MRPRAVLALSARTDDELHRMRERLAERLEVTAPADLADVAYTLAVGRGQFVRRWSAVVGSTADAITKLRAPGDAASPARWSLYIAGDPADLAELGKRLEGSEPTVRSGLLELVGFDRAQRPPDAAGRRAGGGRPGSGPAAARADLLPGGRIAVGPAGRPVARRRCRPSSLAMALDACTDATESRETRPGPGQLVIGPLFNLDEVLALAWQAGSRIDWPPFYAENRAGGSRCRPTRSPGAVSGSTGRCSTPARPTARRAARRAGTA